MTSEQATLAAALIAALLTIVSLMVTVLGWKETRGLQKQLLERQIEANSHRDTLLLLNPRKVKDLEIMKNWLEDGLRLSNLASDGVAKRSEIDEWTAKGTNFLGFALRADPTDVMTENNLFTSCSYFYGSVCGYFGSFDPVTGLYDYKEFPSNLKYLDKSLYRIEQLIEGVAKRK